MRPIRYMAHIIWPVEYRYYEIKPNFMTPVMCPLANSKIRKLAVETNKTQVRWSFMVPFYEILLHKWVFSCTNSVFGLITIHKFQIPPHFDEINEFLEIFDINRFNKIGPFLSHNQSCTWRSLICVITTRFVYALLHYG